MHSFLLHPLSTTFSSLQKVISIYLQTRISTFTHLQYISPHLSLPLVLKQAVQNTSTSVEHVLVPWLYFLLFYIQYDMSEIGLRAGCLYGHTLGRFDLMGRVDIINQSTNISGDIPECTKQGPHSQEAYPASCEGQLCKAHPLPAVS